MGECHGCNQRSTRRRELPPRGRLLRRSTARLVMTPWRNNEKWTPPNKPLGAGGQYHPTDLDHLHHCRRPDRSPRSQQPCFRRGDGGPGGGGGEGSDNGGYRGGGGGVGSDGSDGSGKGAGAGSTGAARVVAFYADEDYYRTKSDWLVQMTRGSIAEGITQLEGIGRRACVAGGSVRATSGRRGLHQPVAHPKLMDAVVRSSS